MVASSGGSSRASSRSNKARRVEKMANDALGVYAAINSVQAELASSGITKSRENSQQKYMFRGIDDIYNAVSGILAKNKLCIIPRVVSRVSEERQSRSGGTLFLFPAPAGMNRRNPVCLLRWPAVPRASGDEPSARWVSDQRRSCSPRQRG